MRENVHVEIQKIVPAARAIRPRRRRRLVDEIDRCVTRAYAVITRAAYIFSQLLVFRQLYVSVCVRARGKRNFLFSPADTMSRPHPPRADFSNVKT